MSRDGRTCPAAAIWAVSVGTFTSILTGIGIGLATSITAWLLTLAFLAPRLRIEERRRDEGGAAWPAYQFRVASRRWRRDLIDVQVHCNLRIPYHGNQENVLRLKEDYAKLSLKKYRPMAARNDDRNVFSGLL
jgi:hypothetical protein